MTPESADIPVVGGVNGMGLKRFPEARILVVDEEASRIHLLRRVLQSAGYQDVDSVTDPHLTVGHFLMHRPDLLILAWDLRTSSSYELLKTIDELIPEKDFIPILILTNDNRREERLKALSAGAQDFIGRPYTVMEVTLRVGNLLHTRRMHLELRNHNTNLDRLVNERTRELEFAQQELLEHLAKAAEFRDDDTAEHTRRVASLTKAIALELGIPDEEAELMANASLVHDIGKIGIQDEILRKPEELTPEEYEEIKKHTVIGANILAGSRSRILQLAETIALYHHERWDGNGYMGVQGPDIPLPGRIVAVADVFDALTNDRPYKKAWPQEDALDEIRRCSGEQFDPDVVDAFLAVVARTRTPISIYA